MHSRGENRTSFDPVKLVNDFFSGGIDQKRRILLGEMNQKSELEKFVEELGSVSFTKVRRYYGQFLNIYDEWRFRKLRGEISGDEIPEDILIKLFMIKSHVAYDEARERAIRPLRKFLNTLISKIITGKDLENARVLFEALVGFAKGKLRR